MDGRLERKEEGKAQVDGKLGRKIFRKVGKEGFERVLPLLALQTGQAHLDGRISFPMCRYRRTVKCGKGKGEEKKKKKWKWYMPCHAFA